MRTWFITGVSRGLGEAIAARVLEARSNDGARAPDTYRPRTSPGVYVPTEATWAPQWPGVKPFAVRDVTAVVVIHELRIYPHGAYCKRSGGAYAAPSRRRL